MNEIETLPETAPVLGLSETPPARVNLADKRCLSTEYWTPDEIMDPVREYFGGTIDLDPATHPSNPTRARFFFTEADDGLAQSWNIDADPDYFADIFVNPPFGKGLRDWVKKIREAAERGHRVVALLPGQRFEQRYWQENLFLRQLTTLVMVTKRISFLVPEVSADGALGTLRKKGNTYGSMLYCYNGDHFNAAACFAGIGMGFAPAAIFQQEFR